MAPNSPSQVATPIAQPKKFNIYTAAGQKLTPSPLSESQVPDFKRRLEESSGGQVVVKEVLFG
jgi:hypothetical protein